MAYLGGEWPGGRHESPGQSKVSDLECAVLGHQQVVWLEVPALALVNRCPLQGGKGPRQLPVHHSRLWQ